MNGLLNLIMVNTIFSLKMIMENMMYDPGEIYAVSLENGTNGEMHTVSYDGCL